MVSSDSVRFRTTSALLSTARYVPPHSTLGSPFSPVFADMLSLPGTQKKNFELSDPVIEVAATIRSFLHLMRDLKLDMTICEHPNSRGTGNARPWKDRLPRLVSFLDKYDSKFGIKALKTGARTPRWSRTGTRRRHSCLAPSPTTSSSAPRPSFTPRRTATGKNSQPTLSTAAASIFSTCTAPRTSSSARSLPSTTSPSADRAPIISPAPSSSRRSSSRSSQLRSRPLVSAFLLAWLTQTRIPPSNRLGTVCLPPPPRLCCLDPLQAAPDKMYVLAWSRLESMHTNYPVM